jgi:flavin-dependent dehydrogenase
MLRYCFPKGATRSRLFNSLNLLPQNWELAHLTVRGFVNSWGTESAEEVDFIFSPHGHGLCLNRSEFEIQLLESARRYGAKVIETARATYLRRPGDGRWVVGYKSQSTESEILSRFLLIATGKTSKILPPAITKDRYDSLTYLAVRFVNENRGERPFIECFANGWLYFTPLTHGNCVVYVFFDPQLPCSRSLYSMREIMRECPLLQLQLCNLCSEQDSMAQWFAGPAYSTLASATVGRDWALLGDHAESRDPLSASGIHHAVRDAENVCKLVALGEFGGKRRSDFEALRRENYFTYLHSRKNYYAQVRQWENSEFWRRNRAESSLKSFDL